jgi:hypothetical protein
MLRLSAIIGLMVVGALAAEPDSATIVNSGSTNRPGFRIVVNRSGEAEMTSMPRRFIARREKAPQEQAQPIQRVVSHALIERFYSHLDGAKPLASLPAVHCMKSASFGSSMTVAFGGEQTPDLTCGDGGRAAMGDLIRDVNEIVALFRDK